jgi:hypothetical protein
MQRTRSTARARYGASRTLALVFFCNIARYTYMQRLVTLSCISKEGYCGRAVTAYCLCVGNIISLFRVRLAFSKCGSTGRGPPSISWAPCRRLFSALLRYAAPVFCWHRPHRLLNRLPSCCTLARRLIELNPLTWEEKPHSPNSCLAIVETQRCSANVSAVPRNAD